MEADWTDASGVYLWEQFIHGVMGEKYRMISKFFRNSEDKGKSFLYKILEFFRNRDEKISFARYVYLLAKVEPGKEASPEQKELYKEFSGKMYQWIQNDEDCYQVQTAMCIYAYTIREREGK